MKYKVDTMLTSIRKVAEELDHTPTRSDYERHRPSDAPQANYIVRQIGSWDGAVAMSGLNPDEVVVRPTEKKQMTLDDILEAIQFVTAEIDGVPTVTEYRRYRRPEDPAYETIVNHYEETDEPWDAVLNDAGLDPMEANSKEYTREDCLKSIQRVADELGKRPTQSDYKTHSGDRDPSLTTIKQRFNGFTYAVREAGI